jgi:hypothetical protein
VSGKHSVKALSKKRELGKIRWGHPVLYKTVLGKHSVTLLVYRTMSISNTLAWRTVSIPNAPTQRTIIIQ